MTRCPDSACGSANVKPTGLAKIIGDTTSYQNRVIPMQCKDCGCEFTITSRAIPHQGARDDYERSRKADVP